MESPSPNHVPSSLQGRVPQFHGHLARKATTKMKHGTQLLKEMMIACPLEATRSSFHSVSALSVLEMPMTTKCSDCFSLCQSNKIPTFSFYQILGREILNGHYGVAAFVVGSTFSSIPYLLIISLVPGAITYYLVGLQKSFEHFAYFTALLFACMLLVKSLMIIVASIVPDFLMGIITGAGIQGVMMLNGGFFRLLNNIPKLFWRYPMYYISFHKYANQCFFKNEFKGLMFPNQTGGSPAIGGEEILRSYWQVEMDYSKWVDLAILLGMLMVLGIIKAVENMKPLVKNLRAKSLKRLKLVAKNLSTPK